MKVRIWCEIFLGAATRQHVATRHAGACEKFGPSGENMGSNPHFGAIWAIFVSKTRVFYALNTGPVFKRPCCAAAIPFAANAHSIVKCSDKNRWIMRLGLRNEVAFFLMKLTS